MEGGATHRGKSKSKDCSSRSRSNPRLKLRAQSGSERFSSRAKKKGQVILARASSRLAQHPAFPYFGRVTMNGQPSKISREDETVRVLDTKKWLAVFALIFAVSSPDPANPAAAAAQIKFALPRNSMG